MYKTKELLFMVFNLMLFSLLISCSSSQNDEEIKKPETEPSTPTEQKTFLKDYVDRVKYPKFKLGAFVLATEYNKMGKTYDVVNTNFDEFSDGYFMKHEAIVKSDGTFNFTTVDKEVELAKRNNLTMFGHTLCWHRSNNNTYLRGLINGITDPIEQKNQISRALESFIKAMMERYGSYIKAWDVVNEPMSDENPSELKSDKELVNKDQFYWQDYLGKDYVRQAVKYARKYGGDDKLLFLNEYGLEYAHNQNAKCVGLINMIKYWESDNETKIDGIATQMHINYDLDANWQHKQEEAYVNMLKLLAKTGKLIKISEMDMGIVGLDDKPIKYYQLTQEQQNAMADYYEFIVKKYLEIIPADQQYGITQGTLTDNNNPNDSWKAEEPIGLWDYRYNKKPAFDGFAKGLSGK